MSFYISSIIISIIFQIIAKIKKSNYKCSEEISYLDIGKYDVSNKKILGECFFDDIGKNLIILLIPGINLFAGSYMLYKSVSKQNRGIKSNRQFMFSLAKILQIYDNQKSIEDAFRIDGLSEENIKKETKLANEELGYSYITNKMYNDIEASKQAIEYLNQFEQTKKLTRKEKIKLLKQYRKVFVSGSKELKKPIEKTLKISNK